MSLIALMLYGSRARGDFQINSDIDLFGLSPTLPSHLLSQDSIKLNIYNQDIFDKMIDDGSLYVWHLKSEGKIIFDHENSLRKKLEKFSLKKDYGREREEAAIVGWLLFSPNTELAQGQLIVSSLVYVVRTISYTILAERETPAFALRDVLRYINDENIKKLWLTKYRSTISSPEMDRFRQFLLRYVGEAPAWLGAPLEQIPIESLPPFARKRHRELIDDSLAKRSAGQQPRKASCVVRAPVEYSKVDNT